MKPLPCWELSPLKLTSSRKGGGAFIALLAPLLLLSACDKTAPKAKSVSPSTAAYKSLPALSEATKEAQSTPAVENDIAAEVTALRDKYPFKNAEELLQVPEVKEKLEEMGREMAAHAEFQKRVDQTVNLAASLIGLDGSPDSLKLNMDFTVYSDARTNRMLSAILPGKPQPWVDFVIGEVGEAVPDLSYGGLQKSNNGVSIGPLTSPP